MAVNFTIAGAPGNQVKAESCTLLFTSHLSLLRSNTYRYKHEHHGRGFITVPAHQDGGGRAVAVQYCQGLFTNAACAFYLSPPFYAIQLAQPFLSCHYYAIPLRQPLLQLHTLPNPWLASGCFRKHIFKILSVFRASSVRLKKG